MNLKRLLVYVSPFLLLATFCIGQTAVLMPQPKIQFLNQNGLPLAGGCVNTYAAGTTTNQATYKDGLQSAVNANPVILDSAGRASIFLSRGVLYKFVVTSFGGSNCSTGTIQYTQDNVALGSNLTIGGSNTQVQYNSNGSFAGSPNFTWNNATSTLSIGALNTTSGGTLAGTFAGSPIWTGSHTFNAANSFLGTDTHTGAETFAKLNNIFYASTSTYPCTAAGVIALLSDATGQANAEGCLSGFTSTSEFDVAKVGESFKHPSGSTWTFNVAGGTGCGVKLFEGSSFGGENSASSDGFALQAASTANMDSLLCTDTAALYVGASNIRLYNPNGATLANGALHIKNTADGSYFRNIAAANYSGVSIKVDGPACCTTSGWNLVANGNYGTNAQPFLVNAPDGTHSVIGTNFFSTSITHAGIGKSELQLTGANRFWCNNNSFFGLYMEAQKAIADTTTPAIDDNCFGVLNLFGVDSENDDASSTRYLLQIETGVQGGVNAFGLTSGTSLNIVNDIANGFTVATASAYTPINYVSVPSYFTSLNILGQGLKANGKLLVSANAPTVGSGFGTSPTIVNSNGALAFEVNVGTGGVATSGVINMNSTAANGWSCPGITDMNTNIVTRETAFTTTTITVTAASAWTASDKLLINCTAF